MFPLRSAGAIRQSLPARVSRAIARIRPGISQFAEPQTLVPDAQQRDAESAKYRSGGECGDHKPVRAVMRRGESETQADALGQSDRVVVQNQGIAGQNDEQACSGRPQQARNQELPAAAQAFQCRRFRGGGGVSGHIPLCFSPLTGQSERRSDGPVYIVIRFT